MTRRVRFSGPSRRSVLGALSLMASGVSSGARATSRLRLAVVPQLTPVEIYRNWQPLVEILERAGLPCDLVIHPSIATFEQEFDKGLADLAYLNPYHMVMAHRAHGYQPLLRDQKPLEGLLLVLRDAPVQRIEDLRGGRISFPSPNALGASLYIRAMLAQKKVDFSAHYAANHRNAIRQVLAGDSVAAGAVRATYEMEPPEVSQALRVLYTTPAIAPHPLAVHPRVPVAVRQNLISTFMALARDPQQQALVKAVQMSELVVADYTRDYAPLGQLGLERFVLKQ